MKWTNNIAKMIIGVICIQLLFQLPLDAFSVTVRKGSPPPPPRYYTWDDLYEAAKEHASYVSFDNSSPPVGDLAWLPSQPMNARYATASSGERKSLESASSSNISFPWGSLASSLQRGDIVSLRCGGLAGYITQFVSNFTHTSMVWDPFRQEVFESQKSNGVSVYNANRSWQNIVTIAVKRVKSLPASTVAYAVERARSKWDRLPYFPSSSYNTFTRLEFLAKWANKWDTDSMYCSKLAWWTFREVGVDLDSGRTQSTQYKHYSRKRTDYGSENTYGWVGVSPDDIYYSKHLGNHIYAAGLSALSSTLPWWSF